MAKTLLDTYMERTTFHERHNNPRLEGIIATLSDIVEREESYDNLPKALNQLHEFHKMFIDKNKVKDEEELEKVATMMTVCLTMMIFNKQCSKNRQ